MTMGLLPNKACPSCGGEFKLAAFRVDGTLRKVCRECFKKKQRQIKRQKELDNAIKRKLRQATAVARKKEVDEVDAQYIIGRINTEAAQPRRRVRLYLDKIESGSDCARTAKALQRQAAKVRYFDELAQWVLRDAELGVLQPYLYYRGNTYLLFKNACMFRYDPKDRALYEARQV